MKKKYKIITTFLLITFINACSIPYTTQPNPLITNIVPIESLKPIEIKTIKVLPFRKFLQTKNGNKFFIDAKNNQIIKTDKNDSKTIITDLSQKTNKIDFTGISDIQVFEGENNSEIIYILDNKNNQILKLSRNGIFETILDKNLNNPTSIHLDNKGDLYVSDTGNNQIKKILTSDSSNKVYTIFGDQDKLNNPTGITTDLDGNVYISDTGNAQIKKLTPNGILTTIISENNPKKIEQPTGLAIDNNGNILFVDSLNNKIKKIDLTGNITELSNISKDINNLTLTSIDIINNESIIINNNLLQNIFIIDNISKSNLSNLVDISEYQKINVVIPVINVTPVPTPSLIPNPVSSLTPNSNNVEYTNTPPNIIEKDIDVDVDIDVDINT